MESGHQDVAAGAGAVGRDDPLGILGRKPHEVEAVPRVVTRLVRRQADRPRDQVPQRLQGGLIPRHEAGSRGGGRLYRKIAERQEVEWPLTGSPPCAYASQIERRSRRAPTPSLAAWLTLSISTSPAGCRARRARQGGHSDSGTGAPWSSLRAAATPGSSQQSTTCRTSWLAGGVLEGSQPVPDATAPSSAPLTRASSSGSTPTSWGRGGPSCRAAPRMVPIPTGSPIRRGGHPGGRATAARCSWAMPARLWAAARRTE